MILLSGLPYYPAFDSEFGRSRIYFTMIIRLRPETQKSYPVHLYFFYCARASAKYSIYELTLKLVCDQLIIAQVDVFALVRSWRLRREQVVRSVAQYEFLLRVACDRLDIETGLSLPSALLVTAPDSRSTILLRERSPPTNHSSTQQTNSLGGPSEVPLHPELEGDLEAPLLRLDGPLEAPRAPSRHAVTARDTRLSRNTLLVQKTGRHILADTPSPEKWATQSSRADFLELSRPMTPKYRLSKSLMSSQLESSVP